MSRRLLVRLAWVMAGALVLVGPPPMSQEEEDLTAGLKAMRAAFNRARERTENLDFAGAIRELGSVIEPRRSARAADLSAEEMELLCAAYDMRARSYFNLGNVKSAEADFNALVKLNPGYPIDRQTLSPKVVDLFDRVRARVAGILVLRVDPPRAHVNVDGDPVEAGGTSGIGLLAGNHRLRIEYDGFDPHEETLAIVAGAESRRDIRLRPNRRTLQFITVPPGVSVAVDGSRVGTTIGPGTPEVEALASQYGFDPKNASSPLLVPLIAPGDHKVTFERECFRMQTVIVKVALDLEQNAPLKFAPVVLQEARTDLRISSTPSGADVFVDGEKKGTTPLSLPSMCGGERDVLVTKPEVGSWQERVRLVAGQVNALDVHLRPTLLYAGTFRLDDWGRAVWSDEDKALLDELGKGLKTLNLVRSPDILQDVRDAVIKWMITEPNEVRAGTVLPPAILAAVASKSRADLVLAGLTLENDPDKSWRLALYSVLHPTPDVVVVRTDKPEAAREFLRRIDSAPAVSGSWWGMGLVDTLLDGAASGGQDAGGPAVVRVLPGSPAAKGGLRVGDRIKTVGSKKTTSVRQVEQALASETARPAGLQAAAVLAVEDAQGTRTVRMAPGESPLVIPLTDPSVLYNRALAEFRLRSRAATDETDRGVALLNVGVAYMHFRAYDKAQAEGFSRASLPQGTGVSEGTVLFYRGLCALRKGDPAAARAAFASASSAEGATLESGDGPSASSAAARMLRVLD